MKFIKSFLFSLFVLGPQLACANLPNVVVETPQGEKLDLWEFKGKPMIITLWASWCDPCRKKLPSLAKLQAQYPHVRMLAISIDKKNLLPILKDIQAEGVDLKNVYHDQPNALIDALNVKGIPCTLVFDAQGREISRITNISAPIEDDPEVQKIFKNCKKK